MAQLAIKGHADRGDEVIKILELMGGKKSNHNSGKYINLIYFINLFGYIEATSNPLTMLDFTVLTLEEVEALMPYKIGDKVLHEGEMYEITGMGWHLRYDKILYDAKGEKNALWLFDPDKLKPVVKQENMCEESKSNEDAIFHCNHTMRPEVNADGALCYKIPKGYETFSVQDGMIILKPKKPTYPKTYEGCCEVLMGKTNFQDFALIPTKFSTTQYKEIKISSEPPHINLINNFYKLLICRDAYWKIAGEQMGLDKSWEPDWKDDSDKYFICYIKNELWMSNIRDCNRFLVFPTAEMRDAFYENFKGLIEDCKELL